MPTARIAIVGDYNPALATHVATGNALALAARTLGVTVEVAWVPTRSVTTAGAEMLAACDGIWAAPGSPYRSLDGALDAIRFARERGKVFVAT